MTYDCKKCQYNGLMPMRKAVCLGCGRETQLCANCWEVYVTCPGGCAEKWKEEAKVVLLRPLAPPEAGLKKTRAKKKHKDQGDLFATG